MFELEAMHPILTRPETTADAARHIAPVQREDPAQVALVHRHLMDDAGLSEARLLGEAEALQLELRRTLWAWSL